jgi:hypothetical protein
MTADDYLDSILRREAVDTGPSSPVRQVQTVVEPIVRGWAHSLLLSLNPSGSFMKGTANKSGTDIDLFVSLSERTTDTLKELYNGLFEAMQSKGFTPKRQNVSINIKVNGYDVDLVPAKRQVSSSEDHSLYRRKADTWTKTNVTKHIAHVRQGGRLSETRILKLWRNQKGLDFPSFYLELTLMNALSGSSTGSVSNNVWKSFQYLRDHFPTARVVDPANSNNIISDDLTSIERGKVKTAAIQALSAKNWEQIVV